MSKVPQQESEEDCEFVVGFYDPEKCAFYKPMSQGILNKVLALLEEEEKAQREKEFQYRLEN